MKNCVISSFNRCFHLLCFVLFMSSCCFMLKNLWKLEEWGRNKQVKKKILALALFFSWGSAQVIRILNSHSTIFKVTTFICFFPFCFYLWLTVQLENCSAFFLQNSVSLCWERHLFPSQNIFVWVGKFIDNIHETGAEYLRISNDSFLEFRWYLIELPISAQLQILTF